jgi:sulfur-carrier protein
MARVIFTPNLERHVECPPTEVSGQTLKEVLSAVFANNTRLRGYILDEQGEIRKHIAIFIDSVQVIDREKLSDPVGENSEVYVLQSLSGGAFFST